MISSRPVPMRAAVALLPLFVAALGACSEDAIAFRPPYLAASTDSVSFGEIMVGDSEERTVFLINSGEVPLKLELPEGDLLEGAFSVVPGGDSVTPGASIIVHVSFSPQAARDYLTVITFRNDSSNEPEFKLTLRGTGLARDPCRNLTCNAPPARACLTAATSRQYNPAGSCSEGACHYEIIDLECPGFGCDDATGLCREDPCRNLSCNAPPARACLSPATSRQYNPAGTCSNAECHYAIIDTDCRGFGCDEANGTCRGDPCLGVVCQTPPNGCFNAVGLCSGGSCTYTANTLPCDDGLVCTLDDRCGEGTCRGTRRACEAPPAVSCANGVLSRFDAVGSCGAQGICDYVKHDFACQFGCEGPACKNDPCAGGCDDGNPCSVDSCQYGVGCQHLPNDGANCVAPSGACPVGQCSGTVCLSKPDTTCVAQYDADLCQSVDVAGVCSGNGQCVVTTVPPENQCPGCNGFCIKCTIAPGFGFKACL